MICQINSKQNERIHYDIVKEDDKTGRYSVSLNIIIIKGGKLHFWYVISIPFGKTQFHSMKLCKIDKTNW